MNDSRRHRPSHLFSLRLWMEDLGEESEEYRGTVRHVTSGETLHFRDFARLEAFLSATTMNRLSTEIDTMEPIPTTLPRDGQTMLDETTIAAFEASLHGELIQPGDDAYDAARTLYNGMIDKRPRFIARCRDVADVIAAVNFAREHDLLLAIRGGGHNGPGLALADDGLVVDLSAMRAVRVDPEAQTVRVEGGALWADVDHASHPFGLAVPSGLISTTGVGGFTLGGGLGALTRRYGLTIDNLLEADVVLADGRLFRASAEENEDLFWAIRGGGGNFGVVTSFLFRAHPHETVFAGPTLWSLEQAPEIMRWYRDFISEAPETLSGFFAFMTVPPGPPFPEELHLKKVCGIVWSYTGPEEEADEVFAPIVEVGTPLLHSVQPMPYPVMQSMFDPIHPPGMQWYWKADFVTDLPDEAIEHHLAFAQQLPSIQSTMHLYPINGAAHRVGADETAWSYRDATWAMVIVGVDPDPSGNDHLRAWTQAYWEALHPYSAGGAYSNFLMEEGEDRVRASYRDNYGRLVEIKTKYDPENLFRVNQNVAPSPSQGSAHS